MGSVTGLIAHLLQVLHGLFALPRCSTDWLSTVSLLGGVFALLPVAGAVLIAVLRKFAGNASGAAIVTLYSGIGLVFGFLLPYIGFRSANTFLRAIAPPGRPAYNLGYYQMSSIERPSCFVGDQTAYLGSRRSGVEALFGAHDGRLALALYIGALVIVPLFALLCTLMQGRFARRRGPRWPGRTLWIPFVVLWLSTGVLGANLLAQLWLGFAPVALLGAMLVWLFGPPRLAVLDRASARRPATPEGSVEHAGWPGDGEVEQAGVQPSEAGLQLLSGIAEPVAPTPPSPQHGLANTPGPLPFATPQAETQHIDTPQTPQRFRKVRALGTGGFGTVWLAVDTQLDRTVAVKFAHAPDADSEARMMREARALAAVRHPNCVRIYDVATQADGLGIVMEYIEGQSLAGAVQAGGALADVAAARLWSTMAGALDAAHRKQVLHRDVKPSNVIVDPAGAPHLIDFGIARSSGDSTLTVGGMMMGTPDFLAPETAAGQNATPASDAWQLAATVSYALSGKPPRGYRDNTMAALLAAANAEPCAQLPTRSAHSRLLRMALHTDPARRPTLHTVREELTAWLAGAGHSEDGPVTRVVLRRGAGASDGSERRR